MGLLEFPNNFEDARLLLPMLGAALFMAVPILFYGNSQYEGLVPKGAQGWNNAAERVLAVMAVVFSSLALSGPSAVAALLGLSAALILIGGAEQRHIKTLAWLTLPLFLLSGLLFPKIA